MNSTVNGSGCFSQLNPSAAKIGKTFAYCLIFVVSLVGNSLIAITVHKTKNRRKAFNYFFVNMVMSDLLYPILEFPWIITELYVDSWLISGPLGQVLCKMIFYLANVSNFVSIQSLVLIAVDRFGAVVFPLRSPLFSSKRCLLFILVTWLVAMTVFSPYLFAFKLVEYPGKLVCKGRWNEAFKGSPFAANYFLAKSVVFLYFPIALLVIIYWIIFVKLRSQKIPGEQSVRAVLKRAKRNRNILKMAIAVVAGFVLCWVPWSIINLLFFFAWNRKLPCGAFVYYCIALLMAQANCAVNPIICFVFSRNYRQTLKKLLTSFANTNRIQPCQARKQCKSSQRVIRKEKWMVDNETQREGKLAIT